MAVDAAGMNWYRYHHINTLFTFKEDSNRVLHSQQHPLQLSEKISQISGPAAAPSAAAAAPSPATPFRKHNKNEKRARKLTLLFISGLALGFVGTMILRLLFKIFSVVIRREGDNNTGCVIFSQPIKAADLEFLRKDDLSSLQLVGRGGCGQVYKAELPQYGQGKAIAIKQVLHKQMDTVAITYRTRYQSTQDQIKAEIQIVGQIRRRNLLPMWAHVSRPGSHYLVYEFMKNGSLEDVLKRDFKGTREEDWLCRHKIAVGIAVGLEYLHIDHSPYIIHRDLKPAKVLHGGQDY